MIKDFRLWYNGSRLSPDAGEKFNNSQLIVSFLSEFSRNYTYHREISDQNITSDYKKIMNILAPLDKSESESIINEVLVNEKISGGLTLQFNFERTYTKTDAVSLLFYNGLLTIEGSRFELLTYSIPNYVIKQLYRDFFRDELASETRISFDMRKPVR